MLHRNEFPEGILLETTLRCPADCIFCPNKKIDTRLKDMPWELFKKIVDECQGKGLKELYPFINGEPLACPYFEDELEYVSRVLPDTSILVYTNGALLDERKSAVLLSNNVREIHFSVDGVSKGVYEKLRRGLVYEQVIANILEFLMRIRSKP